MGIDLPLIWAIIIAFGLMMYVVMDGFDLGIGILFPFVPATGDDRDTMVNTVAPVWDGNETWLVLGGAALLAAFPLAYSVLLSALYLPLILMLAGLIWRGVAFEFRFKADDAHKPFWDKAFAWAPTSRPSRQGVALGAFINGFQVSGRRLCRRRPRLADAVQPVHRLRSPGRLCAARQHLADHEDRRRAAAAHDRPGAPDHARPAGRHRSRQPVDAAHASGDRRALVRSAEPLVSSPRCRFWCWRRLGRSCASCGARRRTLRPSYFRWRSLFLGYSGLAISLWPNIIPPAISFRDAAGPPQSMGFTLVGALFIIPIILDLHRMVLLRVPRQGESRRGSIDASSGEVLAAPHRLARPDLDRERHCAGHRRALFRF